MNFDFKDKPKPPEEDLIQKEKQAQLDAATAQGQGAGGGGQQQQQQKSTSSVIGVFSIIGLNILYGRVKAQQLDDQERTKLIASGQVLDDKYKIKELYGPELDHGANIVETLFSKGRWEQIMATRTKNQQQQQQKHEATQHQESSAGDDTSHTNDAVNYPDPNSG